MTKTSESRQNFRMKADNVERGAGVQIGDRVVSASTIDYSSKGAKLVLLDDVEVNEGDELRVAISQGQYRGVVRRLVVAADGKKVIGVEFSQLIHQQVKMKNSTFIGTASGGRSVSGNFAPAFYGGFFFLAVVAVFAYYYFLVN